MSHFDPDIYSSVLVDIGAEYVKIAKNTMKLDKMHKYLGINIDYSSPGKVIFSMVD